jgi:phospholipid/cholesterol/gamma-HCH transport system substrate-binding protein
MDLHYQKEVGVGTLVLVGIGLFIAGTAWLKGAGFSRDERTAQVQFADIGTLKQDNAVTVSGVVVGQVKEIEFKEPGRVLVTITLPPSLPVRTDAVAKIDAGIFTSDARIVLETGTSGSPLQDGGTIRGSSDPGLFAKGSALADRADSVLLGVQALANQQMADNVAKSLQAMERLLNTLNKTLPQASSEAEKTMVALRQLSGRLDSTIATIPVGNAIERADTLARNLSTMSVQLTATGARLDTLLQLINSGQGTLGKFATDSGFYVDSRATAQSLKLLLDELTKHPGKIQVQVKLF